MAPVPQTRSPQSALLHLLPWCASVLLVLYGVGVLNSVIPLQPNSPQWQLRLCEALINQIPLVLMGVSVAVIAHHWDANAVAAGRIVRWTTRAALPLTVGFALLIPLQGAASLQVLQAANRSSSAFVANTNRNLEAAQAQIRLAQSSAELELVMNQLPTRLPPVEQLGNSFSDQQQRLQQVLEQLRGRAVLQVQLNRQQQQTLVLRNSLRLGLLAALLAWLFQQARPQPLRLGRWRLPSLQWLRRPRPQRRRGMAPDMARYCDGVEAAAGQDAAERG
jgi:hypothetical protein